MNLNKIISVKMLLILLYSSCITYIHCSGEFGAISNRELGLLQANDMTTNYLALKNGMVPDCSSNPPCQNGATCSNLVIFSPNGVGYTCNCADGFVGFYCQSSKIKSNFL